MSYCGFTLLFLYLGGRRKMADYAAENTMYNAGDSHKQGTARR